MFHVFVIGSPNGAAKFKGTAVAPSPGSLDVAASRGKDVEIDKLSAMK